MSRHQETTTTTAPLLPQHQQRHNSNTSNNLNSSMCRPLDAEVAQQTTVQDGYQLLAEFFSTLGDTTPQRPAGWPWSTPIETPPTSGTRRRLHSYDTTPTAHQHQPRRRLSLTEREREVLVEFPYKQQQHSRRSLFSLRNLLLLGCAGGLSFLLYAGITALQGATPSDVREIDAIVDSFRIPDDERDERLREIKASMVAVPRILVVGMAESLQELQDNDPVISALQSLCWVHADQHKGTGTVDVRILYKSTKMEYPTPAASNNQAANGLHEHVHTSSSSNDMDDDQRVLTLQGVLTEWGCNVVLEPEEIVWQHLEEGPERIKAMQDFGQLSRYKRLAKLRSFHRAHILASPDAQDYAAVVNVDMDVVQLPPVLAMLHSIERMVADAVTGQGSVVCANGFEVWRFPYDIKRQMYYDTLAAIDANGVWAYHKMTTSIPGVIKFAQNTFLRDVLRHKDELQPMQSCFGGVAMYDFETWATPECDYDESRIRFVPPYQKHTTPLSRRQLRAADHAMASQLHRDRRWTLDPQYTLQDVPGGDACEHVTFQKCLHDFSKADTKRTLKIGIQPDLVIERDAAILGRTEDVTRVAFFLGKPALILTLLALSLFPLIRYWKGDYNEPIQAKSIPVVPPKKHVHEA